MTCTYLVIEIFTITKETSKIIIVTNDSAVQYNGLLGFVLTTTDDTILSLCYGQPSGHELHSFQSEACVFLVATYLIFLIVDHYKELITDSITIY